MTTKIIVIGAGMAGIMAAKTLVEAGFKVTLLEARDRIGGRTFTDYSIGASVDLGAAWIHGPIGNPLTPLKEQFGVASSLNDLAERDENSTQAYDHDGTPLDMAEFGMGRLKIQAEIIRQLGSQLTDPIPDEIISTQQLADYVRGKMGVLTAVEEKAFHYAMQISRSNWDAADPEQTDWRDEEAIERAISVLQKLFGPMPQPKQFVRTHWQMDPCSLGSYSFNKVGQHLEDRHELAKPVDDRLFFAGEATHDKFYGTVHAAYESGVRAAREILEIKRREKREKE